MTYLAAFDAPPLEDVTSTLRGQLAAGIVFHARQLPPLPKAGRLLFSYLLVTDKAVREYRAGYKCISEHMAADGGITSFVEGIGHFENCINSTKRALRLLTRLANNPDIPSLDRTVRHLAQLWSDKVTGVRDAIEHIDYDIVSETGLPDGSAHMLTISHDGSQLEISSHSLTFVALASTLRSLLRAGTAMIQTLPTLAAPAPT